ncbi:cytochrome P450 [Nonomuraea sp. NPDC049152]|uniref:cytochrome P450 n=1 Tax=Nonomuraea sp. NPDC049152 TaxID=3154350 RepID=UPI0033D26F99
MSRSTLPTARQNPFDPPQELRLWQAEGPIRPMTYADGHQGWLVTGYAATRAVLGDPRFSVRSELAHSPLAKPTSLSVPPGFFLRMDPPEHTRYRRLLTGEFTVRRMKALEPRIEAIVADQLALMERHGSPSDLVEDFALPIPSLVICELLGVSYQDREKFQRDSAMLLNVEAEPKRRETAFADLMTFLSELAVRKRAEPEDDLLSGLAAQRDLTEQELAGIAFLLLIAGHETTANMLALGTFALLSNPARLAALRDAGPEAVAASVEELLRYLSVLFHVVRVALEDVEVEGRTIKAGESVTLYLAQANRDAERFAAPEELDLTHSVAGHLAFGYGIHQCLGQQLARVEMRIAYPALLRRFPGLRLAVGSEEVPLRTDMAIYGVHALPVAW